MRIRSFQLKIAAVTLLLSGLCLCVFGSLAWAQFHRMGMDRIDLEIRSWGQKQLTKARVIREWERFDQDMIQALGQAGNRDSVVLFVSDPHGGVVYRSPNWPPNWTARQFPAKPLVNAPPPPPGRRMPPAEARFTSPVSCHTVRSGATTWRIGVMANEHVTLVMGVNLEAFLSEMQRARMAFVAALPPALLLVAVAGWLVSRRALRPVQRVTETASLITAQDLTRRIPARDEDCEFEELVAVLNRMLDRLQTSYQQAVRFSADAAHELKTPLTILQGELEQALRNAPLDSPPPPILTDLMEEVQRLKAIVEKLLLLSKADAGQLLLHLESVDLVQLIEETIEDTTILAPGLTVEKELAAACRVEADAGLIRLVLQNLASNAIKYNCPGGKIVFRLRQSGAAMQLTVANTGEPIAPEDRERIFERFHRGDKARGRRVDGVGLGLSLAREIVSAHHGELVPDEWPDGMTAFTMSLPVMAGHGG